MHILECLGSVVVVVALVIGAIAFADDHSIEEISKLNNLID